MLSSRRLREAFQVEQVTLGTAAAQLEETEEELARLKVEMPLMASRLKVLLSNLTRIIGPCSARDEWRCERWRPRFESSNSLTRRRCQIDL